jgi:hypothetical protein
MPRRRIDVGRADAWLGQGRSAMQGTDFLRRYVDGVTPTMTTPTIDGASRMW